MDKENIILEMRGIRKSFGATHALTNVDLTILKNEVHAIVGSNGAGKSTLIKMLAGIYTPDDGTIIYNGENITGLSPESIQKKGIQVVHQALNIVGSMTVLENILLASPPLKNGMLRWSDGMEKAKETLKMIDFPLDIKTPVNLLSVSEQQFVILARAVVGETKILVLDEPTARLGLEETNKLFAMIRKLKAAGTTVIYISHRMEEIYTITDRISVFRDGKCVKTEYTKDFGEEDLVSAMLGKKMESFYPKETAEKGNTVLQVRDICYKDRLHGVGLEVKKGEIVSLVGAVGAGKTELINSIFGIIKPDAGEIEINGNLISRKHTPASAIKTGVALIPEDRAIEGMIGDYNIKNNISSVDMRQIAKSGIINNKEENRLACDIVEKLNVQPQDINYIMSALSGGNQQKVVIGKWMTDPYQIYLMDEVTSGVDIGAKAEIYKLMGMIVKKGGSILLATGDIEEALGISDRIIVLFKGKIIKEVTPDQTSRDALLTYIMGGETANEK